MSTRAWINTLCPECRAALVQLFGGRVLRVPHAANGNAERRAAIRKALDAGVTYREIAEHLHCTTRTAVNAGKRAD